MSVYNMFRYKTYCNLKTRELLKYKDIEHNRTKYFYMMNRGIILDLGKLDMGQKPYEVDEIGIFRTLFKKKKYYYKWE